MRINPVLSGLSFEILNVVLEAVLEFLHRVREICW